MLFLQSEQGSVAKRACAEQEDWLATKERYENQNPVLLLTVAERFGLGVSFDPRFVT